VITIILGVIPCRGGSKTVPRKGLYRLNGTPLIAYTVRAAQASGLDDFAVTTDDEEIAAYSVSLGAKVIRRPARLARDDTPMVPVLRHAVEEYERGGAHVDAVCLLQPTSPLRTAEDIDGALRMYEEDPLVAVVSVCEGAHPKKIYSADGTPLCRDWRVPYDKRADLCYVRNGAVFVIPDFVLAGGRLYNEDVPPRLYVMPKTRSVDIDDLEDMAVAQAILKARVAP
jgi:CMP-N-acetylneuraminic acid synthetase